MLQENTRTTMNQLQGSLVVVLLCAILIALGAIIGILSDLRVLLKQINDKR